MKLPKYQLKSAENLSTFEFNSEGPKGSISKLVQFTPTNYKGVFNLAFGDKNHKTGSIDDNVISNNRDSEKVLATVVATVYAFTDKNPDAWIYATGSSKSRTRLYRRGISKYFSVVKNDFEIYGMINDDWQPFKKEVDYDAFLVKRIKS